MFVRCARVIMAAATGADGSFWEKSGRPLAAVAAATLFDEGVMLYVGCTSSFKGAGQAKTSPSNGQPYLLDASEASNGCFLHVSGSTSPTSAVALCASVGLLPAMTVVQLKKTIDKLVFHANSPSRLWAQKYIMYKHQWLTPIVGVGKERRTSIWSMVKPEKAAPVTGTVLRAINPASANSQQ